MNDTKALKLLQEGEPDALEWFIDRYGSYVGTIVKNVLQNSMSQADVEEVTADVFVTLWKSAERMLPLNIKGYLSRVSRSLALRKLRERKVEFCLDDAILVLEEDSLIERLDREQRDELVRQAVLSMAQPDREIFLRHYYYCQNISLIAEKMQMNPSTVKTRLRRGREKLRQHLTGIENT